MWDFCESLLTGPRMLGEQRCVVFLNADCYCGRHALSLMCEIVPCDHSDITDACLNKSLPLMTQWYEPSPARFHRYTGNQLHILISTCCLLHKELRKLSHFDTKQCTKKALDNSNAWNAHTCTCPPTHTTTHPETSRVLVCHSHSGMWGHFLFPLGWEGSERENPLPVTWKEGWESKWIDRQTFLRETVYERLNRFLSDGKVEVNHTLE